MTRKAHRSPERSLWRELCASRSFDSLASLFRSGFDPEPFDSHSFAHGPEPVEGRGRSPSRRVEGLAEP